MRHSVWQWLLILGIWWLSGCLVSIPGPTRLQPLEENDLGGEGPENIALIEINGVISQMGKEGRFGEDPDTSMVSRIKEELTLAEANPHLRAIILIINSSG